MNDNNISIYIYIYARLKQRLTMNNDSKHLRTTTMININQHKSIARHQIDDQDIINYKHAREWISK